MKMQRKKKRTLGSGGVKVGVGIEVRIEIGVRGAEVEADSRRRREEKESPRRYITQPTNQLISHPSPLKEFPANTSYLILFGGLAGMGSEAANCATLDDGAHLWPRRTCRRGPPGGGGLVPLF